MNKNIVIFIGAPGSGKDTQAFKLARKYNFFLFQSSAIMKRSLAAMSSDDPIRIAAEALYKKGELVTPELVAKIFEKEIRRITAETDNYGIAFSGCFRTIVETKALAPLLSELFEREHIHIFFLDVSKQEAVRRNMVRKVCEASGHPLPDLPEFKDAKTCRYDGSAFIQRDLDVDPETVAHRYDVFVRDTYPVLDFFKSIGYEVVKIDGEQPIQQVEADIAHHAKVHPL